MVDDFVEMLWTFSLPSFSHLSCVFLSARSTCTSTRTTSHSPRQGQDAKTPRRGYMLHTRTAKDPCWLPKRLSIPTSEVPVETDRSNLWKTRLIAPCPMFCDAREEENRKHQPLEDLRNHIQPPPLTLDHCFTITITYLLPTVLHNKR